MTGFGAIALLAAACWLVRLTFIVFVPAHRLPRSVTAALGHVPPAVLSALVCTEIVGATAHGSAAGKAASLGCVTVIAVVAYRRPNLSVSAGLGIASVLLIDLILIR